MSKINLSLLFFAVSLGLLSCGGSPSSASGGKPLWVDNLNSVYNRLQYVAAVGYASDRQMAERSALSNLSSFFGQSIQSDQTIRNTYFEAARSGAMTQWFDSTDVDYSIRTTTSMDILIGAEIRETWYDERNRVYYAAAVMDRQRTIQIYTNMISDNLRMINNLVNAAKEEGNSLEAVSRYRFAGAAADINTDYANILNVLGASPPAGVTTGDQYRLEALNIARVIPIGIIVTGDRSARIQNAFAKIFNDFGFRTGTSNPHYVLYVNVSITNPEYPNTQYQWAQMELNASLTDPAGADAVLLPFTLSIREGHNTTSLAENRAFLTAEQKIESDYKELLSSYMNQLFPK